MDGPQCNTEVCIHRPERTRQLVFRLHEQFSSSFSWIYYLYNKPIRMVIWMGLRYRSSAVNVILYPSVSTYSHLDIDPLTLKLPCYSCTCLIEDFVKFVVPGSFQSWILKTRRRLTDGIGYNIKWSLLWMAHNYTRVHSKRFEHV